MSTQWVVNMSGNGIDATITGLQITMLVVHITNNGESRPLKGGNTPRREYVGWLALADDVSAITGLASPNYAWRDIVWLNFPTLMLRLPQVYGGAGGQFPDAIQWGMFNGATATVWGVQE